MTNKQTARQKQTIECTRLVQEKKDIEAKIQDFESILRSQNVGMKTALVDSDGYPRGDIDIYAIKHARASLAPLYNDLQSKTVEIEQSLIALHAIPVDPTETSQVIEIKPFAKVNGVAPDSPAGSCGLQRGDLILMFGEIDSLQVSPLQKIAAVLPDLEFKSVKVKIQRGTSKLTLVLVPKPWEGKGYFFPQNKYCVMFFGFEVEPPEENKTAPKAAAPTTSWNVWDSLKEAGQIVARRDLSDLGQMKFKEEEDANEPAGAIESALDTLDESLEKAEKLAIKGISDLSSGIASGFSKLFVQKPGSVPANSSLSDRATKEVFDAGIDPNTYADPLESNDTLLIERFTKFRDGFDQIAYAGRISRKYDEQPEMIKLMKSIVPDKVTEEDFWLRYYFKVSELNFAQEQRLLLLKTGLQDPVEEEIAWSSDEEESKDDNPDTAIVDEKDEKAQSFGEGSAMKHGEKDRESESENAEAAEVRPKIESEEQPLKKIVSKESVKSELSAPIIDRSENSNSLIVPPAQSESVSSGGFEIVEEKDDDWGGWD